MNFPDCAACLADLVRVLRVQHEPTANANLRAILRQGVQRIHRPARMVDVYTGSHFDHNGTRSVSTSTGVIDHPHMEIVLRTRMTVRGLWSFFARQGNI